MEERIDLKKHRMRINAGKMKKSKISLPLQII